MIKESILVTGGDRNIGSEVIKTCCGFCRDSLGC
jgi:hypothetical protein